MELVEVAATIYSKGALIDSEDMHDSWLKNFIDTTEDLDLDKDPLSEQTSTLERIIFAFAEENIGFNFKVIGLGTGLPYSGALDCNIHELNADEIFKG